MAQSVGCGPDTIFAHSNRVRERGREGEQSGRGRDDGHGAQNAGPARRSHSLSLPLSEFAKMAHGRRRRRVRPLRLEAGRQRPRPDDEEGRGTRPVPIFAQLQL